MNCSANTLGPFSDYIDEIEELATGREVLTTAKWRQKIVTCLDGEPGQILRREKDYSRLRQQGAFFTGAKLAAKLANSTVTGLDSGHVYYDPTCGAGDLLLAIAKKLPIADTLEETLANWGLCISGCDISPYFVRLAKARLVLLAAKRCRVRPHEESVSLSSVFPNIVEADFLADSLRVRLANVVLMNPPFGYTRASVECQWAKGRVNAAAIFAERAIKESREGTRIAAILPDVLRSGSRYERWRVAINGLGTVHSERPLGLFGRWADVDVYLLDFLRVVDNEQEAPRVSTANSKRPGGIGKRFAVHVGSVVPHRDKQEGPEIRYIHARSLPAWGECTHIAEHRKFSGRLFEPPFVAVRRTSRPGDSKRAIATLVLGSESVAVENHLIVLLPRDGGAQACRELMVRLRSNRTDNWINSKLRCRHLTTGVLADMPWWYKP